MEGTFRMIMRAFAAGAMLQIYKDMMLQIMGIFIEHARMEIYALLTQRIRDIHTLEDAVLIAREYEVSKDKHKNDICMLNVRSVNPVTPPTHQVIEEEEQERAAEYDDEPGDGHAGAAGVITPGGGNGGNRDTFGRRGGDFPYPNVSNTNQVADGAATVQGRRPFSSRGGRGGGSQSGIKPKVAGGTAAYGKQTCKNFGKPGDFWRECPTNHGNKRGSFKRRN